MEYFFGILKRKWVGLKSREQEDAFIVVMILVNYDSKQGTFCLFQRSGSDNRVPNILDLIQEK